MRFCFADPMVKCLSKLTGALEESVKSHDQELDSQIGGVSSNVSSKSIPDYVLWSMTISDNKGTKLLIIDTKTDQLVH